MKKIPEMIRAVMMPLKRIHQRSPTVKKERYAKLEFFCKMRYADKIIRRMKMKIKKMKTSKTTKKKWELKMKKKEPLQSRIVNIMSSTNPFY